MLHVIKRVFPNKNESRLNTGLMNREYEKNLEEYVVQCFRSIELVLDNIKMTSYKFTDEPEEIDLASYEQVRKSDQIKDLKRVSYIKKSLYGELSMTFLVELTDDVRKSIAADTKLLNNKKLKRYIRPDFNLEFVVRQLIPMADETGRYLINGVKFNRLYQLTETSTYITANTDVLKSVMPIMTKRGRYNVTSASGTEYVLNQFKVILFKGFTNAFVFYFATMGWHDTLDFFRIAEYISLEKIDKSNPLYEPGYEYFPLTTDNYMLKINKKLLGIKYLQGMIGTIIAAVGNNKYTYEDFINPETWIKRIGLTKKKVNDEVMLDLGRRNLILFFRMYNDIIRESLRLQNVNRKHVYAIIRWMIQHYDEIRDKDNLDFKNKRLRGNEQYAALLDDSISSKIKTLLGSNDEGRPENIVDKYRKFFSWRGRELVSKMHKANLIRSDDSVNDMDMFNKLKYTKKGPNSLGNKNVRNIAAAQRAIHVSEIGIDSLCTCSASEPGLTNFINPLCETDGLFFRGSNPEPENFYNDYMNDIREALGKEKPDSYAIIDIAKFANLFAIHDEDTWGDLE